MAFVFVIWIGIGWALYREGKRFGHQNGQYPWGMPPLFWGFVGLMLGLIGAVFMLIAVKTTTKRPANNVVWSQGPYADPRYAPPPQQWTPPAPVPGPTGQWGPPPAPVSPPPQQWSPPAPPGAPAPSAPSAPNVGGSEFLPKR